MTLFHISAISCPSLGGWPCKLLMTWSMRGNGRVLCHSQGKVGRMQLSPTSPAEANEMSPLLLHQLLGERDVGFYAKKWELLSSLWNFAMLNLIANCCCCYLGGKCKCGNSTISKFWHEPVITEACLQGPVASQVESTVDLTPCLWMIFDWFCTAQGVLLNPCWVFGVWNYEEKESIFIYIES